MAKKGIANITPLFSQTVDYQPCTKYTKYGQLTDSDAIDLTAFSRLAAESE